MKVKPSINNFKKFNEAKLFWKTHIQLPNMNFANKEKMKTQNQNVKSCPEYQTST